MKYRVIHKVQPKWNVMWTELVITAAWNFMPVCVHCASYVNVLWHFEYAWTCLGTSIQNLSTDSSSHETLTACKKSERNPNSLLLRYWKFVTSACFGHVWESLPTFNSSDWNTMMIFYSHNEYLYPCKIPSWYLMSYWRYLSFFHAQKTQFWG